MIVRVRLFAILRDKAGVSELTLDLPNRATVETARDELAKQIPLLSDAIGRIAFAVNQEYATLATALSEDDELALIPPVSGG